MKVLFSPVVAVLNRLGYRAKFVTVLSIAAAVGIFLVAQLYSQLSGQIVQSRREVLGLETYPAAVKVLVLMQQHRGLTSGLLGGSEDLRPKVADKARALEQAIGEFDAVLSGPAQSLGLAAGWGEIKKMWQPLRDGGQSLGQAENFKAHTRMVERTLALIIELGDRSHLALDPEAASFNLIDPMLRSIPEATERLGRLRGKGTGVIARRVIESQDHDALIAQLAELSQTAKSLAERVARAAGQDADAAPALQQAGREIAAAVTGVRDAAFAQVVEGRFEMPPAEFFALGTAAIDTVLKHLDTTFRPTVAGLLEARLQRLEGTRNLDLAVAVAAMVLLGYLMMGMYFAIVASVHEISAAAGQLAQGDYSVRLELAARDELSEVARQFNDMTGSLGGLVREVKLQADTLANEAAQLAQAARRISEGSEQQSEAASGMAAAIEQMTVSIGEISRHANDAESRSELSGGLSREGGELAERTVAEMERIADVVGQSSTAIEELGVQSGRISNIVSTIREIADQTNLLALNAAIEAARAGESGRGFAVVADEVRKLAERTTTATGEIGAMVGAIQGGTRHAVETMASGVERVREGVGLASRSGEAMRQIDGSAQQVVTSVRDISHALREQGAVSTDIARNVERIARMAEDNHASVQHTADAAERLQGVASRMLDQVARFRV